MKKEEERRREGKSERGEGGEGREGKRAKLVRRRRNKRPETVELHEGIVAPLCSAATHILMVPGDPKRMFFMYRTNPHDPSH